MMKNTIKKERIQCDKHLITEMCEAMKFCKTTIYAALNFYCNSENAMAIRRYALEHGGHLITEEKVIV